MRTTPPPTTPDSPAALPAAITADSALDLAAGTGSSPVALTPRPASVATLECAINSAPCVSRPVRSSVICQLARLNNCVAPFNFNLSALAGIFLWFLLFFLIADICPPYFARCVCRACQDDGGCSGCDY